MIRRYWYQWLFGLGALSIVIGLFALMVWAIPFPAYGLWIITMTLVTFLFYALDKYQATGHGTRVPEIILHLLCLGGGFIGTGLGMVFLHHKSNAQRHLNFRIIALLAFGLHSLFYGLFIRG